MRSYLAGPVLLLLLASSASAQATGQVLSLGYHGNYRPDCWTPLLVQLRSTISDPQEYQIQVHQQDLDKDTVVYRRVVTLNAQAQQDFWVYFVPQPTDGGLPRPGAGVSLQDVLRVELYDKEGKRQIARLPVNVPITNIDPGRLMGGGRGRKLVLFVLAKDKPALAEYAGSRGIVEDVHPVLVTPRDLPDNVLGYQGVDSIVWLDADSRDITGTESTVFDALQRWVRWGGQLVVCHPTDEPARINPFADADMLPVVAKTGTGEAREWAIGVYTKPDLDPLVQIALQRMDQNVLGPALGPGRNNNPSRGQWAAIERLKAEWEFAFAGPRPEAVVDSWIDWDPQNPGYNQTPYIARRPYGLGSVVWVAHDLGDPTISARAAIGRNDLGWPHVWDQVFGWKNDTYTDLEYKELVKGNESRSQMYQQGSPIDLGPSLLKGMEHTSRGAALILLAVLFFIAYWVVAGPGSFLFLAQKKRKGLSWMAYAVAAVAATGVTLLVVNLVLRGSAQAKHVSIVKLVAAPPAADGSPRWSATVHSRFGLYIPKDDKQDVAIADTTVGDVNYLIPFAIHPQHLGENKGFTDRARYEIDFDHVTIDPNPDAKEGDKTTGRPVLVEVPYRNTLKKLEGLWTGTVPWGIAIDPTTPPTLTMGGSRPDPVDPARRLENSIVEGRLINRTGRALKHVYFAFNWKLHDQEARDPRTKDWLLYVPAWAPDGVIDLAAEFTSARRVNSGAVPKQAGQRVRGTLDAIDWPEYWYSSLKSGLTEGSFDDHDQEFIRSHPMLTLFGRYAPQKTPPGAGFSSDRRELHRRRAREMDMSQLLAAGQLLVFGQADGPMPLPLEVNGDRIEGEGVTFYQLGLPLDRTRLVLPPKPPTRPTTGPASQPAGDPADDAPDEPPPLPPPTDPAARGPAFGPLSPARRGEG